jgi:thymidylate kinase
MDMPANRSNRSNHLISFSGIDGAGKSTQIESLCSHLREVGLHVKVIRFWDEIASLTWLRESAGHTLFNGDKGIGTPAAPISRKDKNIRSWPMTAVRLFIYFLDAISTRRAVKSALRLGPDVVIFDRYIYDEFANLELSNPAIRVYVRLIMKLVPRPDISYLLDASPEKARARKPEYPLEFLRTNRQSYMALQDLIGGITVIGSKPLKEVTQSVTSHTLHELWLKSPHRMNGDVSPAKENHTAPTKLDDALTN